MTSETIEMYQDELLAKTGVRRLTPDKTRIFEGTFSLLHCAVEGDNLYRGVFAVLMFPIRHPEQFVSMRYTDLEDKEKEIGIIENLLDFSSEAQKLIRASLTKHYYERIISRVISIDNKFGLLFFKVELADGNIEREFMMRWSYNSAEEFGEKGKVLIDAHENRYIIPDVSQLPSADQRVFTSYIYW